MSRIALPNENVQEAAYQALKNLFKTNSDSVLAIEILPSSIPPPDGRFYLQDENSVGIPKKTLTIGFLAARRTFAIRKSGDQRNVWSLWRHEWDDALTYAPESVSRN